MTNPIRTPISTFTVQVEYRSVTYDVEITPLMHGSPILYAQDRIDQWNGAEKTHQLFSRKIVEMLQNVDVPADSTLVLTAGSKEGFTFGDTSKIAHKTSDRWDEFIQCLEDPASHTAGRPELDDEDDVSGQEIGPGARLRCSPNPYLSLSPEDQQKVQFAVFKKKCREYFCKKRPSKEIKYENFEQGCLDALLYSNPSQPKMKPKVELRALWDMQVGVEQQKWSLAYDLIGRKLL